MVLLSGLNYDYSGQQSTELTTAVGIGTTIFKVKNTEGFDANDYFVIDPKNENAELIKITTVDDTLTFTASAAKFSHSAGTKLYRLPYNQMKFYSSTAEAGTYTVIAASTTEMAFAGLYTNYSYAAGTSSLYYKRTFYNETTTVESAIAEASYWQTGDEELYITADELRRYLQFDKNDYPQTEDMSNIIKLAQRQITLDVNSSDQNVLIISTFMVAKSYVLRALASRSLSKGYIMVNVNGRNVTKAYQELVLEAENTFKEYQKFLRDNVRSEVGQTNFMDDTIIIDAETRQEFIDNWTGAQNGIDYGYPAKNLYGRKRR